jgi:hypothetical protein
LPLLRLPHIGFERSLFAAHEMAWMEGVVVRSSIPGTGS